MATAPLLSLSAAYGNEAPAALAAAIVRAEADDVAPDPKEELRGLAAAAVAMAADAMACMLLSSRMQPREVTPPMHTCMYAWCMVHGAWCMVHVCMVHGAWCMVHVQHNHIHICANGHMCKKTPHMRKWTCACMAAHHPLSAPPAVKTVRVKTARVAQARCGSSPLRLGLGGGPAVIGTCTCA